MERGGKSDGNTVRLVGITKIGTGRIPADKAPFIYGFGPEPLAALNMEGKKVNTTQLRQYEFALNAHGAGQLAGALHAVFESLGDEAVARFIAAYDQTRTDGKNARD